MGTGLRRSKRLQKVLRSLNPRKKPRIISKPVKKTSPKKSVGITAPIDTDWDTWVSATQTRNYLLKDPVIDWIKTHYSPFVTKNPKYTRKVINAVNYKKPGTNFHEFIMNQGNKFETRVIQYICGKFGSDMLCSIGGELNPHSPEKVKETVSAMNKGIPFIHGGVLHNPENQTYGIPDLLIRSDWINRLVVLKPLTKKVTKISAPLLIDPNKPKSSPKYHYRVIDVKFTTLNLRSDGIHLLNSRAFPAYKTQLWIYNEALARVQGYKPTETYILGRRWRFSSQGETFVGNSCFDRLGVINYTTADSEYPEKSKNAIAWIKDVNQEDAKDWNILNVPLEREELYPNMSNTHDYPWHSVKKTIANEIGEITSLWMMGVKNRKRAHSEGVYKWTNPDCTTEILGVTGEFTKGILDKMLEINRPRKRRRIQKIEPRKINNNQQDWKHPKDLEFFVDFETVNDILTDFSDMPCVRTTSLIFMIGVGHINPLTNQWVYRDFTVDSLCLEDEARICRDFGRYIQEESKIYGVKMPSCFHWARAEERFWNDAFERHPEESHKWGSLTWEWVDLMKVFKEEPIVIEGCMGFSLKKVAKTMYKHGFIKTTWDSGSSCLDGRSAMVGAWKAHKEAKKRGISMKELPELREICKYNQVDIKVMQEIIQYLRDNHI